MRRIITLTLAFILTLSISAQEERKVSTNDTIVVNRPMQVVITKDKKGDIGVSVAGKEDDYRYRLRYNTTVEEKDTTEWNIDPPFLKKRNGKWIPVCGGIYASYLTSDGGLAGARLKSGWEFGATHLIGVRYRFGTSGLSFNTGLGFAFQCMTTSDATMRLNRVGGALIAEPLPEGVNTAKLKLVNYQWNLPVQLTQRFGRNFYISAGVLFHNNWYTKAENKYTLDGVRYYETIKDLKQRPLSYEFMGSIGFRDISLFCKYSPQGIFRDGLGPQNKYLSIGVRFMNF